jgi:hypothetical protein
MTALQLAGIIAAALLILSAGLVVGAAGRRLAFRPKPRVLVVLDSGDTFEGVLLRRLSDRLVLGGARLHKGGAETSVDGTVELDRARITWVQVP